MLLNLLRKLGLSKEHDYVFSHHRLVGFWLIMISLVIALATTLGGQIFTLDLLIHPIVLSVGFGLAMIIIQLKRVENHFVKVPLDPFQKRMAAWGDKSLFVLMFVCAGPFWPGLDFSRIWMGVFLGVAIHFLFFFFTAGKSMIVLAILCGINAVIGLIFPQYFIYLTYVDALWKGLMGLYLLCFSKLQTWKVRE